MGKGGVYFFPVRNSLYMTSKLANLSRQLMKILHPVILGLALFSIPCTLIYHRRSENAKNISKTPIILIAIGIYYTLLYSIFAPWPRYSVPLRPELYLCAVWTGVYIFNKMVKRIRAKNEVAIVGH